MHCTNHDHNIINIKGFVINKVLRFNFSTKLDDKDTTNLLSHLFKDNLEKIIFECVCDDISEYTFGDFEDFEPYVLFNSEKNIIHQSRLFLFPPGSGGGRELFWKYNSKAKRYKFGSF